MGHPVQRLAGAVGQISTKKKKDIEENDIAFRYF